MFYCGTKVIVLSSNTTTKASPRVGSIGYIANCNRLVTTNAGINLITVKASIVFIRYGYEKKLRIEHKNVTLCTPSIASFLLENNKLINKTIKKVKNIKSIDNLLLVAPIFDPKDLFKQKDTKELLAYIESFIKCSIFQELLYLMYQPIKKDAIIDRLIDKTMTWETFLSIYKQFMTTANIRRNKLGSEENKKYVYDLLKLIHYVKATNIIIENKNKDKHKVLKYKASLILQTLLSSNKTINIEYLNKNVIKNIIAYKEAMHKKSNLIYQY
jgi:hypothetical protein